MKRISLLTVALLGCLFSGLAQSNSILWEITGKKLEKPSYLYGTIHIQAEDVFSFDPLVYNKLKSCDALAVELVMDEIDKTAVRDKMIMEEGSIKDYLTEEEYDLLDSVVKEKVGQPLFLFEKMKPFFLSSQIMQTSMPKEKPLALDMHLIASARKMDMEVVPLEEFSDQIGAIDKISLQEQTDMLMDNITDAETSMEEEFEKLVRAYVSQDLDSLKIMMQDTALPEAFAKELLVRRNKGMAGEIHKIMKKKSVFAAFGAAHLVGEKGVIELLRKKGYTLKPVPFDFDISKN